MKTLPLEKFRIVCFGTAWAAPMLTQLLADMGAEVIKVETMAHLDGLRMGRPVVGDDIAGGDEGKWPNLQPAFHGLNRNKLGITLDVKKPKGLELVMRLISMSDAVCSNFSVGVMERMGIDYESLIKVKPDIISVELSGVGQYGPDKDATLYAATITALSGLSALIGYYGEPPQGMTSVAYGDATASVHGAFALLAALHYHTRTGKGQRIDLSEAATGTGLLGEAFMDLSMNGRVARPQGNRHPFMSPHNNYRCQGDDKWVAICVSTDEEWERLCKIINNPILTNDQKFSDALCRWENQDELDKLINAWTANYTPDQIMTNLQNAGIAATPVMNVEDIYFNTHFQERQTNIEVVHPLVGLEVLYGIPWRLGGMLREIRRVAPSLGEHNDYVFRELLGISQPEYTNLIDEKVIY